MNRLVSWTGWLAVIPLVALIVLFNAAVVMRYAVGQPIHWTEEMSGLLMIWIVMIGAIAAERDNQHLSITVFTDLLARRPRLVLDVVFDLASVALLLTVAWLGWQLSQSVSFKLTDILRISWFWIDVAVPIGFLGVALVMVARSVGAIRRLGSGAPGADDRPHGPVTTGESS
ncbi:TRAP transporter small permease [Chthonobacter rhizosphaerae]|uniref:TRAP transporter small permease n=1 Tax=Chthonobacter rhizosphaerae TaxID=2735553 RepID=UPI0015EF5881|nr:TRAP transporter small permease [Chthonobacter rhizosphaerae]